MTDTDDVPAIVSKYCIEAITVRDGRKWTVSVEKYYTRRQWALTMRCPDEPTWRVLAYFRTEEKAEMFAEFLRALVPGK